VQARGVLRQRLLSLLETETKLSNRILFQFARHLAGACGHGAVSGADGATPVDAHRSGPARSHGPASCRDLRAAGRAQPHLVAVVPALLALVLSYALYPPMRRLMYAGLSRQGAAALVTSVF